MTTKKTILKLFYIPILFIFALSFSYPLSTLLTDLKYYLPMDNSTQYMINYATDTERAEFFKAVEFNSAASGNCSVGGCIYLRNDKASFLNFTSIIRTDKYFNKTDVTTFKFNKKFIENANNQMNLKFNSLWSLDNGHYYMNWLPNFASVRNDVCYSGSAPYCLTGGSVSYATSLNQYYTYIIEITKSGNMTVWIDGVKQFNQAGTGDANYITKFDEIYMNADKYNVGAISGWKNIYLDEITIWNRSLTSVERSLVASSSFSLADNLTVEPLAPVQSNLVKIPLDIDVARIFTQKTNYTINITLYQGNLTSAKLYYSINDSSGNTYNYMEGVESKLEGVKDLVNQSDLYWASLSDTEQLSAIYPLNVTTLFETQKTSFITSQTSRYVRCPLYNLSYMKWVNNTFLEIDFNLSTVGNGVDSYWTNSTGSQVLVNVFTTNNKNHSHGVNENDFVAPFILTHGNLNGISLTDTGYITLKPRSGATADFHYVANPTSQYRCQYTINNGGTWHDLGGIIPYHFHYFNNSLTEKAYVKTITSLNTLTSNLVTDLIELGNQPPTNPSFYLPTQQNYILGDIVHGAWHLGSSPNGYTVSLVNVSLYYENGTYLEDLLYTYENNVNWTSVFLGSMYIQVWNCDSNGLCSGGTSEIFNVSSDLAPTIILNKDLLTYGYLGTDLNINVSCSDNVNNNNNGAYVNWYKDNVLLFSENHTELTPFTKIFTLGKNNLSVGSIYNASAYCYDYLNQVSSYIHTGTDIIIDNNQINVSDGILAYFSFDDNCYTENKNDWLATTTGDNQYNNAMSGLCFKGGCCRYYDSFGYKAIFPDMKYLTWAKRNITFSGWMYQANMLADSIKVFRFYNTTSNKYIDVESKVSSTGTPYYCNDITTIFNITVDGVHTSFNPQYCFDTTDRRWTYITFSIDLVTGTIYNIYRNGMKQSDSLTDGQVLGLENFKFFDTGDKTDMLYDELYFYDRPLSYSEIIYIYNNGMSITPDLTQVINIIQLNSTQLNITTPPSNNTGNNVSINGTSVTVNVDTQPIADALNNIYLFLIIVLNVVIFVISNIFKNSEDKEYLAKIGFIICIIMSFVVWLQIPSSFINWFNILIVVLSFIMLLHNKDNKYTG